MAGAVLVPGLMLAGGVLRLSEPLDFANLGRIPLKPIRSGKRLVAEISCTVLVCIPHLQPSISER